MLISKTNSPRNLQFSRAEHGKPLDAQHAADSVAHRQHHRFDLKFSELFTLKMKIAYPLEEVIIDVKSDEFLSVSNGDRNVRATRLQIYLPHTAQFLHQN